MDLLLDWAFAANWAIDALFHVLAIAKWKTNFIVI